MFSNLLIHSFIHLSLYSVDLCQHQTCTQKRISINITNLEEKNAHFEKDQTQLLLIDEFRRALASKTGETDK